MFPRARRKHRATGERPEVRAAVDSGSEPRAVVKRQANQRQRSTAHLVGAWIVAVAAMIGDAAGANAEHCVGKGQPQATKAKSGESMVTILVKGTNWGAGRPEVIKNLLENVAWHLTRHFREGIHATIKVVNHQLGPQILLRIRGQTTYTVLLDTSDMYWAQYSYQFAHEFCHLVSNYEQRFGTPNQWIEETICETASLFTLRSMGMMWKEKPPYAPWRGFAKHLTAYANTQAGKVEPQVVGGATWEGWLRQHEDKGRQDPYNREGNRAVALRLLPLFEQYPEGWNAVRNLPISEVRIGQYLKAWKEQVNPCDRAFITKIESTFGLGNLPIAD